MKFKKQKDKWLVGEKYVIWKKGLCRDGKTERLSWDLILPNSLQIQSNLNLEYNLFLRGLSANSLFIYWITNLDSMYNTNNILEDIVEKYIHS